MLRKKERNTHPWNKKENYAPPTEPRDCILYKATLVEKVAVQGSEKVELLP